jgi:hypothetical protein
MNKYGYASGINFQDEINKKIAERDFASAAVLEQMRNNKIEAEGLTEYEPTNLYSQYLPDAPQSNGSSFGAAAAPLSTGPLPLYSSPYTGDIATLIDKIKNYDSYNPSTDQLTQEQITKWTDYFSGLGNKSMKDTIGEVSARTGGLASSYATSAGQQAYDYFMQQADAKRSDLVAQGEQRWENNRENLYDLLAAIQGVDNTAYGRYRDTVSDQKWQQEFDISDYQWQRQFDANQEQNAYTNRFNEQQYADSRTDANFSKAQTLLNMGFSSQDIADTLGITIDQANTYVARITAPKKTGGGNPGPKKPTLTVAQVNSAIKAGNLTQTVLDAYEYYYGEPYTGTGAEDDMGIVETMLSFNNDAQATQYLLGQNLQQWEFDYYMDLYEGAKSNSGSPVTNVTDTQSGGTDWVMVKGYGRVTWPELETLVDSGEVVEKYDPATGKYSYYKA